MNCPPGQYWDNNSCRCRCSSTVPCFYPRYFEEKDCACKCIPRCCQNGQNPVTCQCYWSDPIHYHHLHFNIQNAIIHPWFTNITIHHPELNQLRGQMKPSMNITLKKITVSNSKLKNIKTCIAKSASMLLKWTRWTDTADSVLQYRPTSPHLRSN